MAETNKRKLFIVGGKDRNVPSWIRAAFDFEQFDQDEGSRGRVPEPSIRPDAVIVMKSWIGHKHYYDARALAERLGVPMIEAAGGWAAALQAAAEQDLDWFLKAIEQTKDNEDVKASGENVEEVVESAWRGAYDREWAAKIALERRYSKDRQRFEAAQEKLSAVAGREAAAQRVITEVREAAKIQREALEKSSEEVRKLSDETRQRSERISTALAAHLLGIESLIDRTSTAEQVLLQAAKIMSEARTALLRDLGQLNKSLERVEAGPQVIEVESVTAPAATIAEKSTSNKDTSM
jgi:hypothetical protein